MAKKPLPTLERVRQLLSYDPLTGVFRWKERDVSEFKDEAYCRTWNTRYAGKQAGAITPAGYVLISINKHRLYGHRLAWFYNTGEWPKDQIDHIDGDRAFNAFANLREATQSQNSYNMGARPGTSRFKGVSFIRKSDMWMAQISVAGVNTYLGCYGKEADAARAYDRAAIKRFGDRARVNFPAALGM